MAGNGTPWPFRDVTAQSLLHVYMLRTVTLNCFAVMGSTTPPRLTSKSSSATSIVISTPSASSRPLLQGLSPSSGISSATSIQFLDSPSARKPGKHSAPLTTLSLRPLCSRPVVRWLAAAAFLTLAAFSLRYLPGRDIIRGLPEEWRSDTRIQEVLHRALDTDEHKPKGDPGDWIKKQAAMSDDQKGRQRRPRAALISLVRNEELAGILQSMRQLEYHWNDRYRYPWIFFSEKPFSAEFKVHIEVYGRGWCS